MLIGLNHLQGNMLLPSVAGAWGLSKAWKTPNSRRSEQRMALEVQPRGGGSKLAAVNETPPHFHPRGQLPSGHSPRVL